MQAIDIPSQLIPIYQSSTNLINGDTVLMVAGGLALVLGSLIFMAVKKRMKLKKQKLSELK